MDNTETRIAETGDFLSANRFKLAVAESLTGGLLCAKLTAQPGASQWLQGGFTAYTRHAKKKALKVSRAQLSHHTAYSEEVARAMAIGARKQLSAHFGLAVTGLAGPDRDQAPEGVDIGTVFLCLALNTRHFRETRLKLSGTREEIRNQAAVSAINLLHQVISEEKKLLLRLNCRRIKNQ